MYAMMKEIITEKDLLRQVCLLEQLLNQPTITAKQLAKAIRTTERTVFSDVQTIRDQLPAGWSLNADSAGFQLLKETQRQATELWAAFLPHALGVQLLKELLFAKKLPTQPFLQTIGASFETLKRHSGKLNRRLKPYRVRLRVTAAYCQLIGEEPAIRSFYHRLLLPFTHNNYFFADYFIHEGHYQDFLTKLTRSDRAVETEQIFGTCWFFINTIRIKAGCRVASFSYKKKDPLYQLYQKDLEELYHKEGVYLQEDETFFAFFCFLESWNYNNQFGTALQTVLDHHYPELLTLLRAFIADFEALTQVSFSATSLEDNLQLLLLKYAEAPKLCEQFQLEYQELILLEQQQFPQLYQKSLALIQAIDPLQELQDTAYLLNMLSLLGQQALRAARPIVMTAYFLFQGEPAWKAFLQQELQDYLGTRVQLQAAEYAELAQLTFSKRDIVISNFPVENLTVPVIYLSMVPTKNELDLLTELVGIHYL